MRLHKWYKCDHCSEFHPVEIETHAKVLTGLMVREGAEREVVNGVPLNYLRYYLLNQVLKSSGPYNLICRYFQKLDENVANNKRRQHMDDSYSDAASESRNIEGLYHVVKCIKTNQRVCVAEWKRTSEGTPLVSLYQYIEFFTAEPDEQWKPLISKCTMISHSNKGDSAKSSYWISIRLRNNVSRRVETGYDGLHRA